MNKVFSTCDQCGKQILYGNAYETISRNIEQAEFSKATNEEAVQVIDSELLITLCGKCGNSFHYDKIIGLIDKKSSQYSDTVDLLDEALGKLDVNFTCDSVNFICIAKTDSTFLLKKKGKDKNDGQPGILISFNHQYDKEASIAGKYRHIGSPIAFCTFDWLDDHQTLQTTNLLIQHLPRHKILEIEAFFNLEREELGNINDII